MLIGYARVSTEDQNLEMQLKALEKVGCEKIFTDKISGTKFMRDGLTECMSHLRAGDVFVIWKLDRLGRNTRELIDFVNNLEKLCIQIKIITDNIDTTTPTGKFFFTVLAAFAQLERDLIAERSRAGLAAARAQGRIGGRRKALNPDKLKAAITLLKSGIHVNEVARTLKVSRATLYRHAKITTSKINE